MPEDLAVAGFDDAYSEGASGLSLTTVRQPHREKGRIAAELLLTVIAGSGQPTERLLPSRLVVRESTGPVPRWSPSIHIVPSRIWCGPRVGRSRCRVSDINRLVCWTTRPYSLILPIE